jgi:hypothetical protein
MLQNVTVAGVGRSAQYLILDDWGLVPTNGERFPSSLCVHTGSGAHPVYPVGSGDPFHDGRAWPGCDADHSPPFSAEVQNEYELHLLFQRYLQGI